MSKLDDLWAEIQRDSALPRGDWGQTWQDMKAGLQPAAVEGHLNDLARGLVQAPRNLYEAARHPLNALRSLHAAGSHAAANNLALLRASFDPSLSPAQRQQARDRWLAEAAPAVAGVIKEPGGNWLGGSVEGSLRQLKRGRAAAVEALKVARPGLSDEEANAFVNVQDPPHDEALNRWIDQKLTKYVKNDLGTERDPVRALAEKGILHVPPAQLNYQLRFHGNPDFIAPWQRHVAKTDPAKLWEGASDLKVHSMKSGLIQNLMQTKTGPGGKVGEMVNENPWLMKLDPQASVYDINEPRGLAQDLGFNHLVDELHNAVRPDTDLPSHLRLTPEQLGRTNVPQAVQLVHKINQWREKQAQEANLQLAKNPATHVLKEYPHTPGTTDRNPKGLHWVELKRGVKEPYTKDTLPPGHTLQSEVLPSGRTIYDVVPPSRGITTYPGNPGFTPEEAIKNFNQYMARSGKNDPDLEAALKYEGDQMGHCVGGYCPDVSAGRSRIFSLRDAKGQPHVTVETSSERPPAREEAVARNAGAIDQILGEQGPDAANAFIQKLLTEDPQKSRIVQIKGKANRAPNAEYLPFVQDLVRGGVPQAGTAWSSVGDLRNTGLYELPDGRYATEAEMRQAAANLDQPDMSPSSLRQLTRRPTMWPHMQDAFSHVPTPPQ